MQGGYPQIMQIPQTELCTLCFDLCSCNSRLTIQVCGQNKLKLSFKAQKNFLSNLRITASPARASLSSGSTDASSSDVRLEALPLRCSYPLPDPSPSG